MPELSRIVHTGYARLRSTAEAIPGGPARFQIVFVLACVLALDAADKATVSAVAGSLKQAFDIGNTEIGLLIAIPSFVGGLFTLPVGSMVDRLHRNRILLIAIAIWSIAEGISGFSHSFVFMLATRMGVGAATAAAFPSIASLSGDYFPPFDRARMFGLILGGELVGTGVGFFIGGVISDWVNWHWPFYVMAVLGLVVIWEIWRWLPEPVRGGASWIDEGQTEIRVGSEAVTDNAATNHSGDARIEEAQKRILEEGVQPREDLLLHQDPAKHSLWWAIGYVIRIPTYLLLVIASSLAYFFFGGIRGFGMIYLTDHYGISRSSVSGLAFVIGIGALAGVTLGGMLSERLLRRGWFTTRVVVPGIAVAICVPLFGGGIWTTSTFIGIPLLTAAAAALAAANPSYDAARLDIMHTRLWGRAESGRMVVRAFAEGGAPLLFGAVSQWFGGGTSGLEWTFLLMLLPLLVAASLAIFARRTYPTDVATAGQSIKNTAQDGSG